MEKGNSNTSNSYFFAVKKAPDNPQKELIDLQSDKGLK
jgi:hypothetical protein